MPNGPSLQRDIRVLHIVDTWLKNTENWCFRLISSTPGVRVSILARKYLPGYPWKEDFQRVDWLVRRFEILMPGIGGRVFNRFLRIAQVIEVMNLTKKLQGHVDIVHAHFANNGWEAIRVAKGLKVPLIVSFYGYDYESVPFQFPKWKSRYQELFLEAECFVCEGRHGAKILNEMGCPVTKLNVVRLGVEPDRVPYPEKHQRGEVFRVIQIARLMEKKGHIDSIRAFALAARCHPMEFEIVGGDGEVSREHLLQVAKDEGVSEKVRFVENIDFSQLYQYLQGFDAFLHPSRYSSTKDCEGGAPVVLLDAQLVGLPVVSSQHCDIPDEVIDGVTGFLSPEGSVAGFASGLVRLATMENSEYEAMRLAGRRHVEENFTASRNAQAMSVVYSKSLERKLPQA